MSKEKTISRYKGKVLAIENFGDNCKKYVNDFSSIDGLLYELYQLNSHELSLTDEGLNFIDEYYGLEKVANMILERVKDGVDYKYTNFADLVKWLRGKGDKIVN